MALFALHGFLGRPQDWFQVIDCNVFDLSGVDPQVGLKGFARAFNGYVSGLPEQKRVLCGYSLGGRLALHALVDNPRLWQGAVIVSAHTGLSSEEARNKRLQSDAAWSKRFLTEEWTSLMTAWNGQPAFLGDATAVPVRIESHYDRQRLSDSILHYSLGTQEHLLPQLSTTRIPILWCCGALDTPYRKVCRTAASHHPLSQLWIAPNAGHRLLWQKNCPLKERIEWFVNSIGEGNDTGCSSSRAVGNGKVLHGYPI